MSEITEPTVDPKARERVTRLLALVQKGSSFSEALNDVIRPTSDSIAVMRRTAFARVFDKPLYDEILTKGLKAPPFEKFVNTPDVVPGYSPDTWRVRDFAATDCLATWLEDASGKSQAELVDLSRTLYEYLKDRPGADPLRTLRFQIPSEPDSALLEVNRLFEDADQRFDLAGCNALVQMLRELDNLEVGARSVPLRLLSPELRARCDDLISYVAVRGRYIEEYAKTANYLERPKLQDKLISFLDDTDHTVLSLFGTGGRGKTVLVQWLVARYCVPSPRRIPVAKLDFDDINVGKVREFPPLILLPILEQLNRELPKAPFSELLSRYSRFIDVLAPPARIPAGVNVSGLEGQLQELAPIWGEDMKTALARMLKERKAVIILDTVEEAVLHFPDSLRAAVELFCSAQKDGAQLKLILSGRYNLRRGSFLSTNDPDPIEVRRFSDSEAGAYLKKVRKIVNHKLVPGMIAKGRGNPFILSLIADLVETGDISTETDLESLRPEFEYLIRRIIDRIPDSRRALRWVIRYGVIPRRLTPGFLRNVMAEHLRRELQAEGHRDRVKEYTPSFPRGGTLDFDQLWIDLCKYADSSGWLRGSSQELRFQPEVVEPMRTLLRGEEVYTLLHQSAVEWFEKRAAQEREMWAVWQAEALYHRFQLGDPKFQERYQQCLDDRRVEEGDGRRQILEMVTSLMPANKNSPLRPDGRPLLERQNLAKAHLELAKLGAGISFGSCELLDDPSQVRASLESARKLVDGFQPPFEASAGLVELALAVHERNFGSRPRGLENINPKRLDPKEQYAFYMLQGRMAAALHDPGAEPAFARARELLIRSSTAHPVFRVAAESGKALARMGQLDRALALYNQAKEDAIGRDDADDLDIAIAELHFQSGAYSKALQIARAFPQQTRYEFRIGQVEARCLIALGQLSAAESVVEHLKPDSMLFERAQYAEVHGMLDAAFYRLVSASEHLERSVGLYRDSGLIPEANEALLRAVRVAKDQRGDWSRADALLRRYVDSVSDFLSFESTHLAYLRTGSVQRESVSAPTAPWVDLAIELIAKTRPQTVTATLHRFVEFLATVKPIASRYKYLHFFRWVSPIMNVRNLEDAFLECVPSPTSDDDDFFPHVFAIIDFLRVLQSPSAGKLLSVATSLHGEKAGGSRLGGSRLGISDRLLEAASRLDTVLPPRNAILESANRGPLELRVVTLLKAATVQIDKGDLEGAAEMMGQIDVLQQSRSGRTGDEGLGTELVNTQVQANYYLNLLRLLSTRSSRTAEDASDVSQRAISILQSLGQEITVRRILAGTSPEQRESPKIRGNRVVLSLKGVPAPWNLPINDASPFILTKSLLAPLSEIVYAMKAVLPEQPESIREVQLAIEDAPLLLLPWEWVFADRSLCFRFSRRFPYAPTNIFTRLFWPYLANPVRRFITAWFPFRVVIVRPSVGYQERIGRGFEHTSRRPLRRIYETHGIRVFEPTGFTQEAVASTCLEHLPHIVHVQVPVSEWHGRMLLNIRGDAKAESEGTGVEYWSKVLDAFGKPPVFILDPPRPPDQLEVARQLMLRNSFAAELVNTGKVRAVISTGLFEPSEMELVAERLAYEISCNPTFGQMISLFHKELSGDHFSTTGAALYVGDPEGTLR